MTQQILAKQSHIHTTLIHSTADTKTGSSRNHTRSIHSTPKRGLVNQDSSRTKQSMEKEETQLQQNQDTLLKTPRHQDKHRIEGTTQKTFGGLGINKKRNRDKRKTSNMQNKHTLGFSCSCAIYEHH